MNTIPEQAVNARRRRRNYGDDFKANLVASCMQPGISMAAVAMAHGINANLLRRWVREAEMGGGAEKPQALVASKAASSSGAAAFVPMQLSPASAAPVIRIELRRGATAVHVSWPAEAADACAAWMRELLR